MSEDDDWFERALRELEESDGSDDLEDLEDIQDLLMEAGDGTAGSDDADGDNGDDADGDGGDDADGDNEDDADGDGGDDAVDDDPDREVAEETGSPEDGGDGSDEDEPRGEGPTEGETDPFGGVRDDAAGSTQRNDGDVGDPFVDGTGADDDPFGGGEGDGTANDPFGGPSEGAADPFGGGSDQSADPFGGVGDQSADPFGGAGDQSADPFGGFAGGGGDDFGFASFDSPEDPGPGVFDDEEFESDIDRVAIGIDGLDEMILGGVPRRSLMSIIGSAGTGKTTFALQFLNEALKNGEKGVYITLEQSREAIIDTAEERGWPFERYSDDGLLAVVSLDPVEMANSLASLRNDLYRLITDFGAERLVLDSVSLLEMMYDHPAKRRSEVFDFTRSLKRAGVTTLLTSEASDESPYTSKHGIVEYLTDAVFILQYVRTSNFQETRLAVEILKIRDANHSREAKPYEITTDGISVYRQANIF